MSRRFGSARISCAGEAISGSRTFLGAPFSRLGNAPQKACFGATPKPARETRALPETARDISVAYSHNPGVSTLAEAPHNVSDRNGGGRYAQIRDASRVRERALF